MARINIIMLNIFVIGVSEVRDHRLCASGVTGIDVYGMRVGAWGGGRLRIRSIRSMTGAAAVTDT
jgi:hypothetical protein